MYTQGNALVYMRTEIVARNCIRVRSSGVIWIRISVMPWYIKETDDHGLGPSHGPVGYSQKNWVGVCGPLSKTLTLFMTKNLRFSLPCL